MNVKTPSLKIPSFTFRIEILILLLLFMLMTTCFTFQSCCKVDWYEGKQRLYATVEEFSNLNKSNNVTTNDLATTNNNTQDNNM